MAACRLVAALRAVTVSAMQRATSPGDLEATVAISTLNRPEHLARTLDALAQVDLTSVFEVLVVDQSDAPFDPEPWRARLPIRVVQQNARGLGVSRNEVIRLAKTPVIVFIDDDVVPETDLIAQHLLVYHEHPNACGVAGFEQIPAERRSRLRAHLRSALVRALGPYLRRSRRYARFLDASGRPAAIVMRSGLFLCDFSHTEPCRVMTPRGCNMSFRREALEAVGGFDTAIAGPRRDETDLALRLLGAIPNAEIWFNPKARLVHLMAATGGVRDFRLARTLLRELHCELWFARRHLSALGTVVRLLTLLVPR